MPLVSSNMNRFLKIEGHPTANSGNFSHLVLQHNNGTQVQLTQGYFDVMGILHWDEKNKIV